MLTKPEPSSSIEDRIIEYVKKISKGAVRLNHTHAETIIDICTPITASVKFCRYNHQTSGYDELRTIQTTDLAIYEAVNSYLSAPPTLCFYRYDCFDSKGNFQSHIFSAKSNIF